MEYELPNPLPVPTEEQIRKAGWSGDVTRFPLTKEGFLARCNYNGIGPEHVKNPAWFYAPNEYVQTQLNERTGPYAV